MERIESSNEVISIFTFCFCCRYSIESFITKVTPVISMATFIVGTMSYLCDRRFHVVLEHLANYSVRGFMSLITNVIYKTVPYSTAQKCQIYNYYQLITFVRLHHVNIFEKKYFELYRIGITQSISFSKYLGV